MSPNRTLVIVGGVAGGATAAARARRMNEQARIILLEKDEHVSFANCGLPYYIGGEIADRSKLLLATPEKFRSWFNIDVRTFHQVTAIDRQAKTVAVANRQTGQSETLGYDKLILSPGASPILPAIDGVNSKNVFTLRNVPDSDRIRAYIDQASPKKAVVVGAGFIGLEMVEMLHHRGLEVSLVELAEQVLPLLDSEMARQVQNELAKQKIELHLGTGLMAMSTDGDRVTDVLLGDATKLKADLVVLAIGVRPNTELAKAASLEIGLGGGIRVNQFMQTSDPSIYAVGDAVEYVHGVTDSSMRIPLAGPANRAGRIAGEHAATDSARPMPKVLGTSIVRVFGLTAAMTGLSEKAAAKADVPCKAAWVPANHHVGYYPGAQEMILKLIYAPDGRVLGAQAVGGAGVDKRMDVIATAIRFGANVDQLTELDLCYAPPFGGAKDPVHVAAYVAQNDLRQIMPNLPVAPVESLSPETQVLDVRTAGEWNSGHSARARWIPLHELRDRLGELNPKKPVAIVCRGGQRAYYAGRILKQNGFADVAVVSGGMWMQ